MKQLKRLSQAQWRAIYASLMDKFHWHPDQIARLTDRQIFEFCFHKRNQDGGISIFDAEPDEDEVQDDGPVTPEKQLASLDRLHGMLGDKLTNYKEAKEKLLAKIRANSEQDTCVSKPD